MSEETPKPMTNAERQRAFRARKAAQTATEVRGVFAHPDDHQAVKNYAPSWPASEPRLLGPNTANEPRPGVGSI